jgi:hypothetical protein
LICPVRAFFDEDSVFGVISEELAAEPSIVGPGRPTPWPWRCGRMSV